MKRVFFAAAALVLLVLFARVMASVVMVASGSPKGTHLQRTEAEGIDVTGFDQLFLDANLVGSTNEVHGVVVLKDGKVIYEKYDPAHRADMKHALWSGSKTFTATAIGIAADEGLLSVDDPVVKFFDASELPAEPSDSLKTMTVWNLLTMSSGFRHDMLGETEALALKDPTSFMLHDSFSFYPGEMFSYNSMNTYLLSVIITKVTGKKLVDYLEEKLFRPMGIKDFYWKESAEGYSMGGWGLFLRTEDLAKMGQLFLNKGEWDGKRIVSEKWIDEAMSVQIMQPEPASGRFVQEDWVESSHPAGRSASWMRRRPPLQSLPQRRRMRAAQAVGARQAAMAEALRPSFSSPARATGTWLFSFLPVREPRSLARHRPALPVALLPPAGPDLPGNRTLWSCSPRFPRARGGFPAAGSSSARGRAHRRCRCIPGSDRRWAGTRPGSPPRRAPDTPSSPAPADSFRWLPAPLWRPGPWGSRRFPRR